jgi:hypothetical protein
LAFGRVALGDKIEHRLLTKLIITILEKVSLFLFKLSPLDHVNLVFFVCEKKGTMPVGEVGKNLQSLIGCESLSKRLKDQYSGLKRAIETGE